MWRWRRAAARSGTSPVCELGETEAECGGGGDEKGLAGEMVGGRGGDGCCGGG